MKKALFLLLFGVESLLLGAQSNIRLNNYWENTHYINPASTNEDYLGVYSAAIRQQWAGFFGAPKTLFASATLYNEKKHAQFGLNIFQDKTGYTSTYDINFSYSYSIHFNYDWQLHLGLGLAYQGLSYDISKVDLSTEADPLVYESLLIHNNFNADLGAEITNKDWRFGISGQHIFSLFSDINKQFVNTNFLYAMYRSHNHDLVDFGGGVCGIEYAKFLQMEMNVMSYFKSEKQKDLFNIGIIYRTKFDIGALFGVDLGNNLHLSYCFDYDVGGISQSSYGTHEFMLIWRLKKNEICHCYN